MKKRDARMNGEKEYYQTKEEEMYENIRLFETAHDELDAIKQRYHLFSVVEVVAQMIFQRRKHRLRHVDGEDLRKVNLECIFPKKWVQYGG